MIPDDAEQDRTVRLHPGSAWGFPPVRHSYCLLARDASLTAAIGLLHRSLACAVARFLVLLAASICVIVWLAVMFGGAAFLGSHIASVFGLVWFVACLLAGGFVWGTGLRYALHLVECGHVAVLTELITTGAVVNVVLRGVTRYLDKVIFSYTIARGDEEPWRSSREGLIYYVQNARPILKTALWSVVIERVLTVLLWVVLLIPAGFITLALPQPMREWGGVMTVLVAILLAGPLRAAFIKPLFLTMMMVRCHNSIEGQTINLEWDARLSSMSSQFRDMGAQAAAALGRSRWSRVFG